MHLIIFFHFLFFSQIHSDFIGKWKLIEANGELVTDIIKINLNVNNTVEFFRNDKTEKSSWKFISGKKSSLLIIGEGIYSPDISGDTLFLLSDEEELVLLREKED